MISFVIPTLNEEKLIESTLQNISSYRGEKEIIVSDDLSSDRTVEIAKKYATHVIVRKESEPRNIGAKRNAGAKLAQGTYIAFVDADMSIVDPENFFKTLLTTFEDNSHIVGQSVSLRVGPTDQTFGDKIILSLRDIGYMIMNNYLGISSASSEFQIVRRDSFIKTGGFNETLVAGEDNEFFHRLGKLGKTYIDLSIRAHTTGRRQHAIGWPRLLWQWAQNSIFIIFLNKSASKEWIEIR